MNRFAAIAPLLFTLVGAGAGICAGMLMHNRPPYRIPVSESLPWVVLGMFVGVCVGFIAMDACDRRPRLTAAVGWVSAGLLGAAMMAPLGWITGTEMVRRGARHGGLVGVMHLPSVGMAAGAVIGCAVGLAHAWVQMRLDRRRPGAGPPALTRFRSIAEGLDTRPTPAGETPNGPPGCSRFQALRRGRLAFLPPLLGASRAAAAAGAVAQRPTR